jgi:hypothetical protein
MAAVAYIAPHIFLTLYAVHGRFAGCHKRRFPLFVHRCASGSGQMDSARDWYWEGNVVSALRRHLEADGWTTVRMADTRTKERGVDLEALRDGKTLLVEAKGYPSKGYSDPRRATETKPTNPTLQANGASATAMPGEEQGSKEVA